MKKVLLYLLPLYLLLPAVVHADVTSPVSPSSGTDGLFSFTTDGNGAYMTIHPATAIGDRVDTFYCTASGLTENCDVSTSTPGTVFDVWNYPSATFSSSYTMVAPVNGGDTATSTVDKALDVTYYGFILYIAGFWGIIWFFKRR